MLQIYDVINGQKVVDTLVSFCNFVFLREQKTKKLPAFEVQYVCKKALLANKI